MKKIGKILGILSLLAISAVFYACSSSSSDDGEEDFNFQSLEFSKKTDSIYNNTVYNSVWTTSVNGQELALCFGGADPAWQLMTLISSAYGFIYAAGDYKDSSSNLNTDGTILLTVTQCNSEAFGGKNISSGVAVIKGNKCTLTLN